MDLISGLFHPHRPLARFLQLDEPSAPMLAALQAHALLRRPSTVAPSAAAATTPAKRGASADDDAFDALFHIPPEERLSLYLDEQHKQQQAAETAASGIAQHPSVGRSEEDLPHLAHAGSTANDEASPVPSAAAYGHFTANEEGSSVGDDDDDQQASNNSQNSSSHPSEAPEQEHASVEGYFYPPASARIGSFDDIVTPFKKAGRQIATRILRGIFAYGFEEPSPVQQLSILPIAGLSIGSSSARDVVVCDRSGEGKTGAIAIGAVLSATWLPERMPASPEVLILVPTRELAEQTARIVDHIAYFAAVDAGVTAAGAAFIGGSSVQRDIRRLAPDSNMIPRIVVANVGRAGDLMRRGALKADAFQLLVLDEADSLLAASNDAVDALYDVFRFLPRDVRVAAVGTTMADASLWQTMKRFMRSPLVCTPDANTADGTHAADAIVPAVVPPPAQRVFAKNVEHYAMRIATDRTSRPRHGADDAAAAATPQVPPAAVARAIEGANARLQKAGQTLVFAPTRAAADFLADRLRKHGFKGAAALHGDLPMLERTRVMEDLRRGSSNVVVTTDQFGRGIDVPHVCAVVVVTGAEPRHPSVYAHCAGRCGRYGLRGVVVTVSAVEAGVSACPEEAAAWMTRDMRSAFPSECDLVFRPLAGHA